MATELPCDELTAFYAFLGKWLELGSKALTPEQCVQEFREYQSELNQLRSNPAVSHKQFIDGEANELDEDALLERVEARLH